MEWNDAVDRAGQAVRNWLKDNRGEEQIANRRYYTFREYSPGSDPRYLLLVTGLKPARGNYSSIDFVVISDRPAGGPIVYHFGDGTDRYVDKIELKSDGIMVDYHCREEGQERPVTPRRSIFLFDRGSLQEVVLGQATEWESTTMFKAMHRGRYVADVHGIYTVQPGDSVLDIAREFKLRVEQLALMNPEVTWENLIDGQKIRVRPVGK